MIVLRHDIRAIIHRKKAWIRNAETARNTSLIRAGWNVVRDRDPEKGGVGGIAFGGDPTLTEVDAARVVEISAFDRDLKRGARLAAGREDGVQPSDRQFSAHRAAEQNT